jgi:hypothetical protein
MRRRRHGQQTVPGRLVASEARHNAVAALSAVSRKPLSAASNRCLAGAGSHQRLGHATAEAGYGPFITRTPPTQRASTGGRSLDT